VALTAAAGAEEEATATAVTGNGSLLVVALLYLQLLRGRLLWQLLGLLQ